MRTLTTWVTLERDAPVGWGGGVRTHGQLINSQLLYH